MEGVRFRYNAAATDHDDDTIIWSFSQLPLWLEADSAGVSGIPPDGSAGLQYRFQMTASDGKQPTGGFVNFKILKNDINGLDKSIRSDIEWLDKPPKIIPFQPNPARPQGGY